MKFSKEEISLCKQVAEKHMKPLRFGDWYYFKEKVCLIWSKPEPIMDDSCIPLWIISDCLEFLRERKIDCELFELNSERKEGFVRVTLWKTHRARREYWFNKTGKTSLEACLKAVLAVLEETK